MSRQSGADDEIEVTPEMIEAGVSVYIGFTTGAVTQSDLLTEADLVSAIYRSMQARHRGHGSLRSA